MKNFSSGLKAAMTALVLLGGLFFASGAQAQGSVVNPPVVSKGTWVSSNSAITILNQEISLLNNDLLSMSGHPADLAKMQMTYYEYILEDVVLGEAVGTAVEKAYNKVLGEVQLDTPGSGFTANEMQNLFTTAVDKLTI